MDKSRSIAPFRSTLQPATAGFVCVGATFVARHRSIASEFRITAIENLRWRHFTNCGYTNKIRRRGLGQCSILSELSIHVIRLQS